MAAREEIIHELCVSYWMEIETVMNYIASSINLDGVRAEEIKKSLQADVAAELGHAQTLARRIKTPGGVVPGSAEFQSQQTGLRPDYGGNTPSSAGVAPGGGVPFPERMYSVRPRE